jgi:hypothetical protein
MMKGTLISELPLREDPQPPTKRRLLSRHLSRHGIPLPEPENPSEKVIHRYVPPFPRSAEALTRRVRCSLLLAFADRQHILRGTRTTQRNLEHARLALGRAWAAAAAASPVLANIFETPRS